jgi:hypothetical protein
MSATFYSANSLAHLKIIVVGLLGALAVAWVSNTARLDVEKTRKVQSRVSILMPSFSPIANGVEPMSIASTIDRSRKGARLSPVAPVAKILVGCEPPFSRLVGVLSANLNMRCLT